MINWDRIEGFEWDAGNSRNSADEHSASQLETEEVFLSDRLLVSVGMKHNEPRYQALGQTLEGRHLHVTFTLRQQETKIRVISARDANRKEPAMSKKLKPIPRFRSEAEERVFWETHDSTDYLDLSKAQRVHLPNLKLSTTAISLRLPQHLLERIKIAANKRDVPYQSLIKVWLAEKVDAD